MQYSNIDKRQFGNGKRCRIVLDKYTFFNCKSIIILQNTIHFLVLHLLNYHNISLIQRSKRTQSLKHDNSSKEFLHAKPHLVNNSLLPQSPACQMICTMYLPCKITHQEINQKGGTPDKKTRRQIG